MYRRVVRPVLFRLHGGDAEAAHEWTMRWLVRLAKRRRAVAALSRRFGAGDRERTVFGVRFPGPVGLAAGMDKDGAALPAWPALGFGFVEVGTVTWHPQPGNPRPRLVRLPASEAIVNRMGFNNAGAGALAVRLAQLGELPVPLGISIGKSKVMPIEDAVEDYLSSFRALHRHGDYFAINISSPNTPGLRSLQDSGRLVGLVSALRAEADAMAGETGRATPLLVKIAPDLTETAICEVLQVCVDHGISGVIATNTTLSRDGVAAADAGRAEQAGGLSGGPLAGTSERVVRFVHRETGGALPVIGVGGILDVSGAQRLVDAGASLLQIYTGLIYRGPGLVRRINRQLEAR